MAAPPHPPHLLACVCLPSELFLPVGSSEAAAAITKHILSGENNASEHSPLTAAPLTGLGHRLGMTGPNTHFDESGQMMVAFAGHITNLSELAGAYLPDRKDVCPAELVCAMYRELQPRQLASKLLGDWTLVGYDLSQDRAYGARSLGGTTPLFQGKLTNGTIVLSSVQTKPSEANTTEKSNSIDWEIPLTEIPVCHYVFGWRKLQTPLGFVPALEDSQKVKMSIESSVLKALAGVRSVALAPPGEAPMRRCYSLGDLSQMSMTERTPSPEDTTWARSAQETADQSKRDVATSGSPSTSAASPSPRHRLSKNLATPGSPFLPQPTQELLKALTSPLNVKPTGPRSCMPRSRSHASFAALQSPPELARKGSPLSGRKKRTPTDKRMNRTESHQALLEADMLSAVGKMHRIATGILTGGEEAEAAPPPQQPRPRRGSASKGRMHSTGKNANTVVREQKEHNVSSPLSTEA